MLGHDNVSEKSEIVPFTDFVQKFQEQMRALSGAQEREAAITTERNEMQVTEAIEAFEEALHSRETRRPLKTKGSGTQRVT